MTNSSKRSIIEISGKDRITFLQGLVTNDVSRLRDGPLYAALLTPQGKYLADFFLIEQDDNILMDVSADLAENLIQRLTMYRLRADVGIAPSDRQVHRGLGPVPEGAFADPRLPALGWRRYSRDTAPDAADAQAYEALRVAHCVPETGVELIPNETYILEAGFERLHGVDFHKGCYVGQEVTARMKHKTQLKKGLKTVLVKGEAPVGTAILSDGKPVGTLYSQANGKGIAYLRFDRARGQMRAGAAEVTLAE